MAWLDDGFAPRIRRYHRRDREALIAVIDAVCGECGWMATSRFEPTAAWLQALAEAESRERCLLLAEEDGMVGGWCRVFPEEDRLMARQATLGIGLLALYRRRRIGTALVQQALAWARAAGYESVNLTTHPQNEPARHLFGRCGFVYRRPVPGGLIEMSLRLKSPGPY